MWNANTPVVAAFGAAVISSQNNRTFGGNNVIASASTGAATYQQFKVAKRGVAAIAVYKEMQREMCLVLHILFRN